MRRLLTICCAAAVFLLGSTEGYAHYEPWTDDEEPEVRGVKFRPLDDK